MSGINSVSGPGSLDWSNINPPAQDPMSAAEIQDKIDERQKDLGELNQEMAKAMGEVMYWAGKVDAATTPQAKKAAEIGLRMAEGRLDHIKESIDVLKKQICDLELKKFLAEGREAMGTPSIPGSEEAKTGENVQTSDQEIKEVSKETRPRKLRVPPGIKI